MCGLAPIAEAAPITARIKKALLAHGSLSLAYALGVVLARLLPISLQQ
jgi:acyl dehydratase